MPTMISSIGSHASSHCNSFQSTFTTSGLAHISSSYLTQGSNVSLPLVCSFPSTSATVTTPANLCHIAIDIKTTNTSSTHYDVWLPDDWNHRLLGTGTGGLSGCVDFAGLEYGTSLGFAAIGTNAGHNGQLGCEFWGAPEVLNDFAWRSIHLEAVVGKKLVKAFYGSSAKHSYYSGCSQGGRQGFHAAENFPDDFDGILACAPALNFVNIAGWFGLAAQQFYTGKPGEMTTEDWALVHSETMAQCDALDGLVDQIIAYPDHCQFDPTALLCSATRQAPCLNANQVAGLQKIYADWYENGQLLYPRFDPGAENSGPTFSLTYGNVFPVPFFTLQLFQYAVYGNPFWNGNDFSVTDVAYAQKNLPQELNTWTGDLSAFKKRGGKLIHVHGTQDTIIPSGISSRQYEMTAAGTGASDMDAWYAFYLVPGLDHCNNAGSLARGAYKIGQLGMIPEPRAAANDATHNALLALVEWVENGVEPVQLIGMTDTGETREVCRYPSEGRWENGVWVCEPRA